MLTLTIRTDSPEAEIGLYEDKNQLRYKTWQAHRELSVTIHRVIKDELEQIGKDWGDIQAIAYFEGPGSFTGLRIGATVANALAESLNIPVIGARSEQWQTEAIQRLADGESAVALPFYGREARTTEQKK